MLRSLFRHPPIPLREAQIVADFLRAHCCRGTVFRRFAADSMPARRGTSPDESARRCTHKTSRRKPGGGQSCRRRQPGSECRRQSSRQAQRSRESGGQPSSEPSRQPRGEPSGGRRRRTA